MWALLISVCCTCSVGLLPSIGSSLAVVEALLGMGCSNLVIAVL